MGLNPSINSDCNQNKGSQKDGEKVWLSQQEQAACDPLSVGWLDLKQQDLVGRPIVTPGRPASRSAGTDQTRFPDPRHMHGVSDVLERGRHMVWHASMVQ